MTVREPVFNSAIGFFLGYKHDEFVALLKKREPAVKTSDIEDDDGESYGTFYELDTTDDEKKWRGIHIEAFDTIIMKLRDDDIQNLGTLMHECIHAAQCVLANRGVSADWSESEPLAYLAEYYFRSALGFVRDEQLKVEKKLQAKQKPKKRKRTRTRYTHDEDD